MVKDFEQLLAVLKIHCIRGDSFKCLPLIHSKVLVQIQFFCQDVPASKVEYHR